MQGRNKWQIAILTVHLLLFRITEPVRMRRLGLILLLLGFAKVVRVGGFTRERNSTAGYRACRIVHSGLYLFIELCSDFCCCGVLKGCEYEPRSVLVIRSRWSILCSINIFRLTILLKF